MTPPAQGLERRTHRDVRSLAVRGGAGGLMVLPALVLTIAVLGAGLGVAIAQSVGLAPLTGSPAFTLAAWESVASDRGVGDGLRVSVVIAAVSTTLAIVLGFAVAVLVLRSRIGGRLLVGVATATLPLPHLVGATAIGLLLADSGVLARSFGIEPGAFPPLVAGPWWVAVIAEYVWKESAFIAVLVLAAVARGSRPLDEAAAVLGARPSQRIRRVTLPLASPALAVGGTIVFAYVLGSYEVAWLLGRTYPEPLPVLAFRLFSDTDLAARPEAMVVAVLTVGVVIVALAAGATVLRRVART